MDSNSPKFGDFPTFNKKSHNKSENNNLRETNKVESMGKFLHLTPNCEMIIIYQSDNRLPFV